MRDKYPELVEQGRERSGPYASLPGQGHGRFVVRHPKSGRDFLVLANDAARWRAEGRPGPAWEHVSVSCLARDRLPSWAEMCWLKDLFWGPDEWVVQFHPAETDHVNVHPLVLHLWRPAGVDFPRPPRECV